MSIAADFRINWRAEPAEGAAEVPLEALPFEAALVDGGGLIAAANSAWLAAHPKAAAGASCAKWCDRIHESSPDLRAGLLAGLEHVLNGREKRFEQNYGSPASPSRILVSACPRGALILHEPQSSGDAPPLPEEDRWQAHKMETIGRLVGGVAHDFANLITMIAGYGDILINRLGEKDPIRPELDEIRKAANRGARLTAQLLGFTRGETVQPRAIDLNAIVTDMQRMLQPVIGEYVDLRMALKPGLGKVVADPGQMEQVIMNLVLNARDAMPTGGRIELATREEEIGAETARERGIEPGPCVLLAIRDNGRGIDADTMQRLFEPFFTTKEKGRGTGLGLSTVHSIIRQSGGAVWVESAPGAGAVFTICLPKSRENAESGEAA
ncbi:MAG: hypothetical protein LAQ30_31355, partial [Acidobacteriia bacterium]|nr:hypothetical protein [Terriglobia bacterium]